MENRFQRRMKGKLIIFSAPSGAGKTTIVKLLLEKLSELEFSISACSRAKRAEEKDSRDYYFLCVEEFKSKLENDEFLEWEEVYKDHFYGTLKSEIQRIWDKGKHVIFDVDVIGGLNIKKFYGEKALSIFVQPPSLTHLKERLKGRSTDTDENIETRLDKAEEEMQYAKQFDKILINDELEKAVEEAADLVKDFLEQSV